MSGKKYRCKSRVFPHASSKEHLNEPNLWTRKTALVFGVDGEVISLLQNSG